MSEQTTHITRIAYKQETAYAAGNGAAAFDCDPFAAGEVADLDGGFNYLAEDVNIGLIETEIESKRMVGTNGLTVDATPKGYRYKTFTLTCYSQNGNWIALLDDDSGCYSDGALPTTYVFHIEKPGVGGDMDYFDVCGCALLEYELTWEADDWVKEKLTFLFYDVVDGVAVTDCPGFITTAPITSHLLYIAVDNATPYQELGLTGIVGGNNAGLTDDAATTYYFKVVIDGVESEFSITTDDDNDYTFTDLIADMNTALDAVYGAGIVVASITGEDIRITASTKDTVRLRAGTTGTDLFNALSASAPYDDPVGIYRTLGGSLRATFELKDQMLAGQYQRSPTTYLSLALELTFRFYIDAAALLMEHKAGGGSIASLSTHTVYLYHNGTNYLTIGNLRVDSDNTDEIPGEEQVYEHEVTMMNGGAVTIDWTTP